MKGMRAFSLASCLLFAPAFPRAFPQERSWEMTLGTAGEDRAGGAYATDDGGFIVAGMTTKSPGSTRVFLAEVDAEGRQCKWKTYTDYDDGEVRSVWPIEGGGTIVCGWALVPRSQTESERRAFLLQRELDSGKGWCRTYSFGEGDVANGGRRTKDGGFVFTGDHYGNVGDNEPWLLIIRTDSEGTARGEMGMGVDGASLSGRDILMANDGNLVIACVRTYLDTGESDIELLKYLGSLAPDPIPIVWWNTFDLGGYDAAHGLWPTEDGGYLIVGETAPREGDPTDVCLIRTDSDGNEAWRRTYGGEGVESGRSVRETADGGAIICGSTTSFGSGGVDVLLTRTDSEGRELWWRSFGGESDDTAWWVVALPDGGFLIAGSTSSFGAGGTDAYLIRTDEEGRVPPHFIRGDANGDGGLNIADAVGVIYYLFGQGCCLDPDAMDVDDGGSVDLGDAISLLNYLFQDGEPPRAPHPRPGFDPTPDSLRCEG